MTRQPVPPLSTTPRTQADRSDHTQRELIGAAVACLNEVGYTDATVRRIAARAGLSTGALQHHFADKDALMHAVIVSMRVRMLESLTVGPRETALPVPRRVRLLLRRYWLVVGSPEYQAVMQIMLGSTTSTPARAEITAALAEAERVLDARWADAFTDTGLDRTSLISVRRVALATLRGLALRGLHSQRDPNWPRERAALAAMVEGQLVR